MKPINTIPEALWLVSLVFLFVFRKKFTQPEQQLSRVTKIVLSIFSIVIIFVFSSSIFSVFRMANYPDYKQDLAQKQAQFHLYLPSYLPQGMQQRTIYRVVNDPKSILIPGGPTISWAYGMPLSLKLDANSPIITIKEAKVDTSFNLKDFITTQEKTSTSSGNFIETKLSTFSGQAMLRETKLTSGKIFGPVIYILSSDNVLIFVTSNISTSETLNVVESLK